MIEVSHLSKAFHHKVVLKDISFNLDNQIYGLLGPNGSGKTTLFRVITNLIKKDKGQISHQNTLAIGYLPQKFNVLEELTVFEQMYYFSSLKKIPKQQRKEMIFHILQTVHLEKQINEKCSHLSGGMLRRLGIAQAIMGEPELVLLDEPTAGLDPEERLHFKSILKSIEGKYPIILSTHIVEDIEDVCQNILVLYEGQLLFNGHIEDFRNITDNRVYEIPISILDDISQDNYFITKYINKDYVRIISFYKNIFEKNVPACIEDSYMYIIRKYEKFKM